MVVDMKSTTDASRHGCEQATTEFAYHIQLGMVDEGLRALGFKMEEFVLLFIEKTDPWALNHKPMPGEDIEYGRRQFQRTVERWAEAIRDDFWPSYDDDEREGGLKTWYRERLAYESKNHLLPKLRERTAAPDADAEAF
jgi:hypothetical protein